MPTRQRTRRTSQDIFARPFPAAVVYDLSARDQATIRVPAGSVWTSGPHWHDAHTEHLQVLRGRARLTLAGRELRVGPRDGVVTVPRGAVHEWRRADARAAKTGADEDEDDEGDGKEEGEELVVREWTDPRDGAKEVFFRNVNGLILDADADDDDDDRRSGGTWSGALLKLDLWNLFWRADNYPVVLGSPGWLGTTATRALMGVAVTLGWVLGCRGVYEEYSLRPKRTMSPSARISDGAPFR